MSQYTHSMIDHDIIDKGAINCFEMISESSGNSNSDVGHFIRHKRQEIVNEMLWEYFRGLVHNLFTHKHKQLSSLECGQFPVSEIVLHDLNDCFHLLGVYWELYQKWSQCCCCCRIDSVNTIFAEFEKHGQELLVNSFKIKQCNIVSKILGKKLFGPPIISSFVES